MTDTLEWKKYLNGKRDFWIYAILVFLIRALAYLVSGIEEWVQYTLEALFLLLLYQGYVWVWYFDAAKAIYNLIRTIIMVVIAVPELDWMIYVYPLQIVISKTLGVIVIVALNMILIVKKDLKYFVKVKQQKRRGELSAQRLQEMRRGKKEGV